MAFDEQEIPDGENSDWQRKQERYADGGVRTPRERQGSKRAE